jgi:hypothetical protein
MTLWRVRASKTRHVLRIAEVMALAVLVQVTARGGAGRCGGAGRAVGSAAREPLCRGSARSCAPALLPGPPLSLTQPVPSGKPNEPRPPHPPLSLNQPNATPPLHPSPTQHPSPTPHPPQTCAFFFSWAAGKCVPKDPEWGEDYGLRWGGGLIPGFAVEKRGRGGAPAPPLPSLDTALRTQTGTRTCSQTNDQCAPKRAPQRFTCQQEGTHNDLATLFLENGHDTIVKLFSVGATPGQPWVRHFTQARRARVGRRGAGGGVGAPLRAAGRVEERGGRDAASAGPRSMEGGSLGTAQGL